MARRTHSAINPGASAGRVVGNGHCVAYVREAAGLGHTSTWKKGGKVRGGGLGAGTAIATFGANGTYENRTDGASHTAILIAETPQGLQVWDQWRGQPVHQRLIRFKGGQGTANNDGDQYHVIMTEDGTAAV
jgi:hypothetical protein